MGNEATLEAGRGITGQDPCVGQRCGEHSADGEASAAQRKSLPSNSEGKAPKICNGTEKKWQPGLTDWHYTPQRP